MENFIEYANRARDYEFTNQGQSSIFKNLITNYPQLQKQFEESPIKDEWCKNVKEQDIFYIIDYFKVPYYKEPVLTLKYVGPDEKPVINIKVCSSIVPRIL